MSKDNEYSIESEIGFSWNKDILTAVIKEIGKKNNEIISECVCEHFNIDLSTLREYIDVKQNGGFLYLCCEENYNRLAGEEGAVNEIAIKENIYGALSWFIDRLNYADTNEGAMIDEEDEVYSNFRDSISSTVNQFRKELKRAEETRVIVFFDEQDNFDCYYEIVVRKIKVF